MQTYPTLKFIKKHGKLLAIIAALAAGLGTALGFSSLGLLAVPLALAVFAVALFLGWSFAELVMLIMSMLAPE